ncbi:MAG: LuxR C-terminal-related transcriptional regulator [Pirellulaceae bacterium]|nr:LuxR C-terminal-related transcriptional regulator [Pirellulaceae bacterium]
MSITQNRFSKVNVPIDQMTNSPIFKPESATIPVDTASHLIQGIVRIAHVHATLVDRRQAVLDLLLKILGAKFATWSWGYGDLTGTEIQPIAMLTSGYSQDEMVVFCRMGLDPESERLFRRPIWDRMKGSSHSTVIRRDIFADLDWSQSKMRDYLQEMQADEWIHALRHQSRGVWSNMCLIRRLGDSEFTANDVIILDLAMQSIAWLHATASEGLPSEALEGLTDKQRLVTLLLLDGFSRKMIATHLNIAEATVGDHIKSIFRHFKVNSAMELSAFFLRNK